MPVQPVPEPTLIVVKAQFLPRILVITFDFVAPLRKQDQSFMRRILREVARVPLPVALMTGQGTLACKPSDGPRAPAIGDPVHSHESELLR